jgi:peptidoglycan lytic transglycosylase B
MAHAHMNLTKDEVQSIQTALRQAGDDPGNVDGVLGKKTRGALRSYQKAHSLKVTGMPDDETCARLGVKTGTHASSPM